MVKRKSINHEEYNDIVNSLVGVLSDEGKSLEDYRKERVAERYGVPSELKNHVAETNSYAPMIESEMLAKLKDPENGESVEILMK